MHARSRSSARCLLAAGLVLGTIALPAGAQSALSLRPQAPLVPAAASPAASQPYAPAAPAAPAAPTTAPAAAGPTMDAASVAVRQQTSTADLSASMQARRRGYGRPMALMVVGGAALLVGLLIGEGAGTAIAVGGAVVGLYGLYEYMQ